MNHHVEREIQAAHEQMRENEATSFVIIWVDKDGVGFRAAGDEYHRLIGGMEVTKARMVRDLSNAEEPR